MNHPPSPIRVPRWSILLVTAIAVVTISAPASAQDPPPFATATGDFGVFGLVDHPSFGGAICFYEPGANPDLLRIKVRRPIVYAYDRRRRRLDSQRVGYRAILQRSDDGSTWTDDRATRIGRAIATDEHAAHLSPKTFSFESTHPYYRVRIRIFWFRGGVDGNATIYPFYYTVEAGFSQFVPSACEDPLV